MVRAGTRGAGAAPVVRATERHERKEFKMPELDIERRPRGVPAWVWVVAAVLLLGLVWWIIAAASRDDRVAGVDVTPEIGVAPGAGVTPEPGVAPTERVAGERGEIPGAAGTEALPLPAILANPAEYFGQTVSGTVAVPEVPSDRGFWVEHDGRRMFAVLSREVDTPDRRVDVNAGQRIRVQGTVYDPARIDQLPEVQGLEAETRRLLQGQPAFLRVTEVSVLERSP